MQGKYLFLPLVACIVAGMISTNAFNAGFGGDPDGSDKPEMPPPPAKLPYRTDFPKTQSGFPNVDVITPVPNSNIQSETAVAIDPANPNIIIAGSNDYRSNQNPPSQYVYYSSNGGITWTDKQLPATSSSAYADATDPSLTYDADGDAYFGFGLFNPSTNVSGVTVQRSLDGGATWQNPVIVYSNASSPNVTFEDKYYITADAHANSPYKNNVYISWTHFANYQTQNQTNGIWVSRSLDKGLTWQPPVDLSFSNSVEGHFSDPAVGPNGEVYVCWANPYGGDLNHITLECAYSGNGGASFSSPVSIASAWRLPSYLSSKNNMRINPSPSIAVDASSKHNGRVYVAWNALDNNFGNTHIYLAYSDTKGSTWSTPQEIDGDAATAKDKFFPWLSCDPISGTVAVGYYDSRNDAANQLVDVYVAYSTDGAATFTQARVTDVNFGISPGGGTPNAGYYWADYTGLSIYKGKIVPCWTDQRSGSSIYNTDAYISIIQLGGPNPATNFTASVVPNSPQSIALSWVDPTTSVTGSPIGAYSLLIYRDGALITTLNAGTTSYTDNGLKSGVQYSYQIYAVANGDTSSVDTGSAIAGGMLQPVPGTLLGADEAPTGTLITWQVPSTHIDGTPLYDLGRAYFYVDGTVLDSTDLSYSDTSTTQTYLIDNSVLPQFTLGRFHSFGVEIVGLRGTELTPSVLSDTIVWYAGPPHTTLNETFEEASPVFGTNGTWSVVKSIAFGGTYSLCDNSTGVSGRAENTWALLPPTIIQNNATQFSFEHAPVLGLGDSAVIEFTTDNGASWTILGNWEKASNVTYPPSGSQWLYASYNMHPYIGDTVVFRFRLNATSLPQKQGWFIDNVSLQQSSGVIETAALEASDIVIANYPNPFTSSTTISISSPANIDATRSSLKIYDALGREVADLSPQLSSASSQQVTFNASNFPAGQYYAILRQSSAVVRKQMTIVK